jgi:hypothetical protein
MKAVLVTTIDAYPARPHLVDGLEDTRLHSELIKFMGRHKSSDTSPTTSTFIAGLRTSFDECCPRHRRRGMEVGNSSLCVVR